MWAICYYYLIQLWICLFFLTISVTAALKKLNETIDGEDCDACVVAMSDPVLHLADVDAAGAMQYHLALRTVKQAKGHDVRTKGLRHLCLLKVQCCLMVLLL